MHVQSFCVNPFQTNCFICHDAGEAVLLDPGTYDEAERNAVVEYIRTHNLVLRHLILTHGHIDHIFDIGFFAAEFNRPYLMHRDDLPLIENAITQAAMFGVRIDAQPLPGGYLDEGDEVRFGDVIWSVVRTPGHSPGSISFIDHRNRTVLGGDVLFRGSIGRTDLWKGSMEVLLASIDTHFLSLDDDYVVYCGHGPATTIGAERRNNPFLTQSKRGA